MDAEASHKVDPRSWNSRCHNITAEVPTVILSFLSFFPFSSFKKNKTNETRCQVACDTLVGHMLERGGFRLSYKSYIPT